MMMSGWVQYFKGDIKNAREIFKTVVVEYPGFLPAILEAGKMEFLLGNMPEAERFPPRLLSLDIQDLHASHGVSESLSRAEEI